jgi:hypothetical protein
MARLGARFLRSGTNAMGHLIEPVLHGLGTDLDRLEQDVVFGISSHTHSSPAFYCLDQNDPF